MLDEKMGNIAKGERKKKEKCSFVLLRFYVDGA